MTNKGAFAAIVGFSIGIAVASARKDQFFLPGVICLTSGVICVSAAFIVTRYRGALLLSSLACILGVVGVARVWIFETFLAEPLLEERVQERIEIQGIITDEPDVRETSQRLILSTQKVTIASSTTNVNARVLLSAPPYPRYSYGDEVKVSGTLSKPQSFETDSGRMFDYESYLKKDGIGYLIPRPIISLVSRGKGNPVTSMLYKIKSAFVEELSHMLPEPHASLLAGLLVGAKRSLPGDLLENFRRVGLIHIVVLSGYNLTIVGLFFMNMFGRFNFRLRLGLGAISIALFALMVGLSATVVRAALMAMLSIVARLTYRRYDVSRALMLTAFLMLLHNPMILVFDPSFQLSFLATIGLIYVSPVVERVLPQKFKKGTIGEIVVATLATQFFVTPYLLYLTGNFSAIALLSNLLVLPTVSITMLTGFLTGVVGMFGSIIAFPFTAFTYGFLKYILDVTSFLGTLPFASIVVPTFPVWVVQAVYVFFAVGLWKFYRKAVIDFEGKARNLWDGKF